MTLRRLLAVTHEATLTGAPANLLHFLRWLRTNTAIEIHTLALADGPRVPSFGEVGPVTVLDRHLPAKAARLADRALANIGKDRFSGPARTLHFRPQVRHLRDFDVVYLNSITSIAVAAHLPPATATALHVHELAVAVRTLRRSDRAALRSRPDLWVAASPPVRDLLLRELRLPDAKVVLHPESIDATAVGDRRIGARTIEVQRRQLGIPADAAVVVGSGVIEWRKGVDLFIQLANEVRRKTRHPVHFVWVGGQLSGMDWERVRADKDRAGADHVHFVGAQEDTAPWFAMGDVFALTSREDPLPLVSLESAMLGVPVVTYRNGGLPAVLEAAGPEAARGVADYLDVATLATNVLNLLHSEQLRRAAADQLRRQVCAHHDIAAAAPRLLADLEALVASSKRARP